MPHQPFVTRLLISRDHWQHHRCRSQEEKTMRKSIAVAAIMIVVGLTQAASAHEEKQTCRNEQGAERLSSEQFQRKIDDLGYTIRRLEDKRGCIEAHLIDRSSGGSVEALFNAATGELVRARPAS
jgi:hypothetical protein